MARKPINKSHRQIGDQTTKGGLIGLFIYWATQNNIDPALIALLVPIISSVLAWLSTKIGDPDLACIFIPKENKDNKD
jgi:uncharacterized membrane protein (Fun14 family)